MGDLNQLPGFSQLSKEQKAEIIIRLKFVFDACNYAKKSLCELFNPDHGLFKETVNSKTVFGFEYDFDHLYQTMVMWFIWSKIRLDDNGKEREDDIKKYTSLVDAC